MFRLEYIDHVALTVADVQRSIEWYRDVLGFERRHEDEWGANPAMMFAGKSGVALFAATDPQPAPDKTRTRIMRHLAFRADRPNFDEAREALTQRGIAFVFEDHRISHSIYFNDPDGHEIEITTSQLP